MFELKKIAGGNPGDKTITLGWTPQPGFGYLFFADDKLVARTNDPTVSQTRFSMQYKKFQVSVIQRGETGIYPTVVVEPPPPPDTQIPTATMSSPADGATVSGTIKVAATVGDNVGVTKVDFSRDGQPIGSDTSAPYSVDFDTKTLPDAGGYTFGARAYDAAGNVGFADQVTVTVKNATDPIPPQPPSGDKLMWKPPTMTAPETVVVSASNRYLELSQSKDYIIKMPSTALGRNSNRDLPALWIRGGRNVVLIGGEILIDELAAAGDSNYHQRAIILTGQPGTVHIEGLWVHGKGVGQAISFDNGMGNHGTCQIQNCRLETLHPVWHTADGDPNEIHTDTIQSWNGPNILRLFKVTMISTSNVLQMQPRSYSQHPLATWDYRHCNFINTSPKGYTLWKQTGPWAEYHEDIWLKTDPNHVAASSHSAWANNGNCWPCWNPGGSWPITGEAMQIGLRPGGDQVPVGVAGLGYTSPGYA